MVWLIVIASMFAVSLIAGIIIFIVVIITRHDKGDYGDGGGKQLGGDNRISIFTPANERAGLIGEKFVNYNLRPLLRDDEFLLANVLLPLKNGHKTEIDCILISRKGIFCIETKKWVGHIIGDDDDEKWIQRYDDPCMEDRYHKNPVKQNEGHCAILKRKLNNKYPVDNVVIFVGLEDSSGINSDYAFSLRQFISYYRGLNDDEIFEHDLAIIQKQLEDYVATPEELERHREEVGKKFNAH